MGRIMAKWLWRLLETYSIKMYKWKYVKNHVAR